jgi:NitT/TauT family transport system ATP-binding protein
VEEAVFVSQRIYVLSVRPGKIKAEVAVDLPPEKTYAMKRSPEFLRYKHDVTDLLRAESA